jgi:hypothetical protein
VKRQLPLLASAFRSTTQKTPELTVANLSAVERRNREVSVAGAVGVVHHQVATEQLAEYASAKQTEASALAAQAEAMRVALGGAAACSPEQLQQQFEGLMKTLQDAVQEAHAFAKQVYLSPPY